MQRQAYGLCRSNYIVEKRHCTLVFDHLNVGNSNYTIKNNAEVTPTDVYYAQPECAEARVASRTLFGYITYTPNVGIESVCSMVKASYGLNGERAAGDTLVPSAL